MGRPLVTQIAGEGPAGLRNGSGGASLVDQGASAVAAGGECAPLPPIYGMPRAPAPVLGQAGAPGGAGRAVRWGGGVGRGLWHICCYGRGGPAARASPAAASSFSAAMRAPIS